MGKINHFMNFRKGLLLTALCFYSAILNAQNNTDSLGYLLDSLKIANPDSFLSVSRQQLSNSQTLRLEVAKANQQIGEYYLMRSKRDSAVFYFEKARLIFSEVKNPAGMAKADYSLGLIYFNTDEYALSLKHTHLAKEFYQQTQDRRQLAAVLSLLCDVYNYMGNNDLAITNCVESLKLLEELGSDDKKNNILNSIGTIYFELGSLEKADAYFNQALELASVYGDNHGMANSLSNLGDLAFKNKDYEKAMRFFYQTYQIDSLQNDSWGLGYSFYNLGKTKIRLGYLEDGMGDLKIAHGYALEVENYELQAKVLSEIGNAYSLKGDYVSAIQQMKSSLNIAQKINAAPLLKSTYNSLAKFYDKLGDQDNALIYFKLYIIATEKQFNQENARKIAETEALYNLEKKEKEIEILKKENEIQQLQANRRELLNYGLLVGLLMVIIMVGVLYAAYRVKIKANRTLKSQKDAINAQKEEIESQRDDIAKKNVALEDKNRMILDSIKYAKRIQLSLLPDTRTFAEAFPDSFIFYKPKDIVSGDFYWFTEIDGKLIVAVVDCTGHGVPGAFMTVMASSLLDQIVNESNITAPDMILSLLDHKIQHSLHNQETDVLATDGVDIGICVINPKTMSVAYAGAKIPLYYTIEGALQQLSPSRYSAGTNYLIKKTFNSHFIKLRKGDMIYLASDGFQDQFGGPQEQKFMKRKFRQLLEDNTSKTVQEQYDTIGRTYYQWKKNYPQTDDILVIGIRM